MRRNSLNQYVELFALAIEAQLRRAVTDCNSKNDMDAKPSKHLCIIVEDHALLVTCANKATLVELKETISK